MCVIIPGSTSNYTNEDSLSEYNNADVSSEYFTGFSFQQAFTAMAATGGIKPAYRYKNSI